MVSKILVALCIVVAAASALPPPAGQPGAGGWGPGGGWGFGAGGFGPGFGGWGQGAGGWGQGVGGWGQGAGGWGRGAGGWGQAAVNPWIPPWVSAFVPQRSQCSIIGSACVDCTSKAVCTPMGGFQSTCADPDFPYCNLGECSATPSAGCAQAAVPEA